MEGKQGAHRVENRKVVNKDLRCIYAKAMSYNLVGVHMHPSEIIYIWIVFHTRYFLLWKYTSTISLEHYSGVCEMKQSSWKRKISRLQKRESEMRKFIFEKFY